MIGSRVGVTISRIAVVSMKQPRKSSSTLIMASTIAGSLVNCSTVVASSAGSRVNEINHPNGTAAAMMNTSTPQKTTVSLVASNKSFQVSSRYQNPSAMA